MLQLDIVCFDAQYNDLLELVPVLISRLKEKGTLSNPLTTIRLNRTFYLGFAAYEEITVLTADP